MTGFFIVNAYLKGKKFEVLHNHFINSAKKLGITLKIKNNEEMIFTDEKCDFVLFWDKDIHLAKRLENRGIPVFNSSHSIELCDNKAKTYFALENIVPQPETIIAPLSYFKTDYSLFVKSAVKQLGLPVVYKECFGSFGEQVYLCNTVDDVLTRINGKPFLLQQFIADSAGDDVRIEVVGGKTVAAMRRTNESDFRSNLTNGGSAQPYEPTEAEKQLAVRACETLGLTFGGVDILNGGLVCEVNSNAHIINLMNITEIDVAPIILKDIINRI